MSWGIERRFAGSYEDALARVPVALKAEGFGVLTEIDLQATLKAKLGVDVRRTKILGACNPAFAHQALQAEPEAALLLPCNVVVYEDAQGQTRVVAVDPTRTMAAAGNPTLVELAAAVKEKLTRALDALSA